MTLSPIPAPLSKTADHVEDGTYVLTAEGNAPVLVTVRDDEVFDGLPFAGAGHLTSEMFTPVSARTATEDETPAYFAADRTPVVLVTN